METKRRLYSGAVSRAIRPACIRTRIRTRSPPRARNRLGGGLLCAGNLSGEHLQIPLLAFVPFVDLPGKLRWQATPFFRQIAQIMTDTLSLSRILIRANATTYDFSLSQAHRDFHVLNKTSAFLSLANRRKHNLENLICKIIQF
jgi:hypothetical protein